MRTLCIAIGILVCLSRAGVAQPLDKVPKPSATVKRAPPFLAGDTVEVRGNWRGPDEWFVSVIVEIKDGQYRISYGAGRYDTAWVTEEKIRNEVKEQEAKAQREMESAFWKEARQRFEPSVKVFVEIVMFPDRKDRWTLQRPERATEALRGLAELDEICKARYAGLRDPVGVTDDYTRMYGTWCKTAAQRDALAVKYAAAAAERKVNERRKWLATLPETYAVAEVHVAAGSWYGVLYPKGHEKVKGVARTAELDDILDGGGAATLAKLRAELAPYFAVAGGQEDAATLAFYGEVEQALAEVKTKVEASLPASVFVAKGKDKAMQDAGKAGITGKILKSAVLSPKWVVTLANKQPENRVKVGSIVYQAGSRCVYRSYVWKQYPRGRGWGPGEVTESAEFYQRCK